MQLKLWVPELSLTARYRSELNKAIRIFHAQLAGDSWVRTDDYIDADYHIVPFDEYRFIPNVYRSMQSKWYILFADTSQFNEAMNILNPVNKYTWVRKYTKETPGYEVTSRGDRRYSPFFQVVKDLCEDKWISAQEYFKKYIQPLRAEEKVGTAHKFWTDLFTEFHGLMYELAVIGKEMPLADMFDVGGGQNKVYCDILNKYYGFSE